MSGLNFYIHDAYPNMGMQDTRTMTQPESYDKKAMEYDDAQARETIEAETANSTHAKKIYMGVAILGVLAIVLGLLHD